MWRGDTPRSMSDLTAVGSPITDAHIDDGSRVDGPRRTLSPLLCVRCQSRCEADSVSELSFPGTQFWDALHDVVALDVHPAVVHQHWN